MLRSVWQGGVAALAIAGTATAASADDGRIVTVPSQPLASSLQAIAKRFGIELLFSQDMLAGRSAAAIFGRFSAQQALELVLAGSGLTIRKTDGGSYFVVKIENGAERQPEAIPDILVIGRRTQNADIRRTQNDVRPYQVVTRQEIATSHIATVEELAAKRFPANAQGATHSQQGASALGETASSINLFGIGTAQTLILVDGRRLPQMADFSGGFLQSDVNAIAPEAIDRVEAITATAGGIYGPGATAGVVNLVLQRDYRGVDVAVTNGVTARGDAPYRRVNARLGFTPDHGATDVMIGMSRSYFSGLQVGDRDYQYQANARSYANDPAFTIAYAYDALNSPSLNVISKDASPLVFKPAFGGTALGSYYTYVPPADGRSTTTLAQELAANAGALDLRPSESRSKTSLLSGRETTSIIASVRHQFGQIEFFADYLRLTNTGHAVSGFEAGSVTLAATDARNPFTQDIEIYPPAPTLRQDFDFCTEITRATTGLIVNLPGSWRGSVDYSFGSSIRDLNTYGPYFTLPGYVRYFDLGADTSTPSPLVDYSGFVKSFEDIFSPSGQTFKQRSRFEDGALRIAGPVARLGGGNLTATLLAEQRSERVSGGSTTEFSGLAGVIDPAPLAAFAQRTRSVYAEVRLPLLSEHSRARLLRGLEVQLAVRHDRATTRAPQDTGDLEGGGSRSVLAVGTVYTAGFKVSPIRGIMLRGSVSTGEQPLTVDDLLRRVIDYGFSIAPDPKRGNDHSSTFFDEVYGGPTNPKPERARSISAGVVLEPAFAPRLRLSFDYVHIKIDRAIVSTLAGDADYFIENEDAYPGRVTRLPLTAEDAALGYTAGVVTRVDTSSLQTGGTIIDTVTGQLDYRVPTRQVGAIDLHGALTWQPRFTQSQGFGLPDRNYRNTIDGAVAIRGNAGARWTKGSWALSIDGQFTGPYRIREGLDLFDVVDVKQAIQQGRNGRIPALVSFDLGLEYRLTLPQQGLSGRPRTLEFRLGVQDALDSRPSTVVTAPGYYNSYADPRRRRFELTVAFGL